MLAYIVRRLLYAIPILIGVNVITFALFFVVNSPDDMARVHLGVKRVTPEAITRWKQERGYDRPLLYNAEAPCRASISWWPRLSRPAHDERCPGRAGRPDHREQPRHRRGRGGEIRRRRGRGRRAQKELRPSGRSSYFCRCARAGSTGGEHRADPVKDSPDLDAKGA